MKIGLTIFLMFVITLSVLIGLGYQTAEVNHIQAENNELKLIINNLQTQIQEKDAQNDQLAQSLAQAEQAYSATAARLQEIDQMLRDQNQTLEQYKNAYQGALAEVQALKGQIQAQEQAVAQFNQLLEVERQKACAAQAELDRLIKEYQAQETRVLQAEQSPIILQSTSATAVIAMCAWLAFAVTCRLRRRICAQATPPAADSKTVWVRMSREQAASYAKNRRNE